MVRRMTDANLGAVKMADRMLEADLINHGRHEDHCHCHDFLVARLLQYAAARVKPLEKELLGLNLILKGRMARVTEARNETGGKP